MSAVLIFSRFSLIMDPKYIASKLKAKIVYPLSTIWSITCFLSLTVHLFPSHTEAYGNFLFVTATSSLYKMELNQTGAKYT